MRSLLIVSMLCSLACAAEDEVVIGDYVIPSHNELRAGIPGDYRRLIQGKSLLISTPSNVCSLKSDAATSATWTQVVSTGAFQNLRLRALTGYAGGIDFPLTAVTADSFTISNVGPGFDLYNGYDANFNAYEVVELWTLSKLFPTDWPNGVQLYFSDNSTGINPSADRGYTLINGVWTQTFPTTSTPTVDAVVQPNSSFIIRNPTSSTLHWLFAGQTRISPIRSYLTKTTPSGTAQDFWMSDSTGYAHSIQDSFWGIYTGQQIYGFGSATAYNPSASTINVWGTTNAWLWQAGGPVATTSNFSMIPGQGYVFRMPANLAQDTLIIFSR